MSDYPDHPNMPMQPVYRDPDGQVRFVKNRIVRLLLDAGPFDLGTIANLPGITREEEAQFLQLIGYSINGYFELSRVPEDIKAKAGRLDEALCYQEKHDVPIDWTHHHSPDCGTKYRGCAPDCPKDIYEKTGKWTG